MRTEIERRYRSGFLLSEQELRRIAQSGQEHFSKLGETGSLKIQAKLRDGSLILSDSLDEIFLVENSGQKAVTKLLLEWQGDQEPRKASLRVEFQDGVKNTKGWDSVSLSVMGDSRDAVFVAASDLEERIKKTRIRSWPYIVNRPWFVASLFLAGMVGVMATAFYAGASSTASAVLELERQYLGGEISNPIEAIILLERLKSRPHLAMLAVVIAPLAAIVLLFFFINYLASRVTLAYVFYWGDEISRYDKHQGASRIFWTVIVLGLSVSILGGLILRAL